MADTKLRDLTVATDRAYGDLVYVLRDPSGTPVDRKMALRDLLGYYTVSGLDATGVSDSSTAIDAVLDAANAAGGGIVLLPEGTFLLDNTLPLYPNVAIVGAGMNATILKSGDAVAMFQRIDTADESEQAQGRNLRDLTLDGDETGTIGIELQRQYYFSLERVSVHSFTSYLMDFEAVLVCAFRDCQFGMVTGAVDGGSGPTTPTGIRARSHNNGSNTWHSNLVTFDHCRFFKLHDWAIDWDHGGKVNILACNFEFCGTEADDSTGVLRFTNCDYGSSFTIRDSWAERCGGFAFVYLGAASVAGARCILDGVLSDHHSVSDLKHGVYVVGSGNGHELLTTGCHFDSHTVTDVTLSASAAKWNRGPTFAENVDTASGQLSTWGDDFSIPEWTTLTLETFDGATPPALPASISGDAHADLDTSATNPSSSPNCLICNSATGVEAYAYFAATDGNSGEARTSARVRLASGGTGYGEARVMVRAASKAASPTSYFVDVVDTGSSTYSIEVFKRSGGTSTSLQGGGLALAANTYYEVTIQAVGTTITGICTRLSDGFYLNSGGTFVSGETAFYSGTDATISGAGYQGVQIYRESGAAVVSVDNLHAEVHS